METKFTEEDLQFLSIEQLYELLTDENKATVIRQIEILLASQSSG